MPDDPRADLTRQLGADPPAAILAIDDEHVSRLADALRGARRRQAQELSSAGDAALGKVPRLLRGPVKKVIGL